MTRNLVAALALAAVAVVPVAHADPTTDDLICQESRMGFTADQIADSIHGGQPNMPEYGQRGEVINQLGQCP